MTRDTQEGVVRITRPAARIVCVVFEGHVTAPMVREGKRLLDERAAMAAPSPAVRMIGTAVSFAAGLSVHFTDTDEEALEWVSRTMADG